MCNEFNQTLLHLYSRLPLRSDPPAGRLVIQCDEMLVQESPKLYVTLAGGRIRKDQLMKLRRTVERVLPDYEVYCLPGDEAEAANMIHQRVAADAAAIMAYVAGVDAAAQRGHHVVDKGQWFQMCLDRNKGAACPQ